MLFGVGGESEDFAVSNSELSDEGRNETIADYWLKYYAAEHCTLCGNLGYIDSTGVATHAGVRVGRVNWCICPNGQILRGGVGGLGPTQKFFDRNPGFMRLPHAL